MKQNFVLTREGRNRAQVRIFHQLLWIAVPLEFIGAAILIWIFPLRTRDLFFTLAGFAVVILVFCANLWKKTRESFSAWGLHLDAESVYLTTDPESTEILLSEITAIRSLSSGLIVKGSRSDKQLWIPSGVENFSFIEQTLRASVGNARVLTESERTLRDSSPRPNLGRARFGGARYGFEIELPDGWNESSVFRSRGDENPEFFCPAVQTSLKFAIGPIDPEPTLAEQKRNLQRIAKLHGHVVISIDELEAAGKRHATMTCKVSGIGVLKNYSLIFRGIEYFVTARGSFDETDSILRTFRASS